MPKYLLSLLLGNVYDDGDGDDDDGGSCVNDHTRLLETVVSQLKCDHWNESCLLLCTRRFCRNI